MSKAPMKPIFFKAIEGKLSSLPRDRIAGIVVISDGEVHDQPSNAPSSAGAFSRAVALRPS